MRIVVEMLFINIYLVHGRFIVSVLRSIGLFDVFLVVQNWFDVMLLHSIPFLRVPHFITGFSFSLLTVHY